MKCQICKDEAAQWAWQPFGPDEMPNSYTLLGSHYRSFPVIKVGDLCKSAFQTGDFPVTFDYKGHHYIGKDHQVKEIHVSLWLEQGTISPTDLNPAQATMIMKDTPFGGSELAALVFASESVPTEPDLVQAFLIAPRLYEACQELDKVKDKIAQYLDLPSVNREDRTAILMALAKVAVEMKAE